MMIGRLRQRRDAADREAATVVAEYQVMSGGQPLGEPDTDPETRAAARWLAARPDRARQVWQAAEFLLAQARWGGHGSTGAIVRRAAVMLLAPADAEPDERLHGHRKARQTRIRFMLKDLRPASARRLR